jgi:hypothetical protein
MFETLFDKFKKENNKDSDNNPQNISDRVLLHSKAAKSVSIPDSIIVPSREDRDNAIKEIMSGRKATKPRIK